VKLIITCDPANLAAAQAIANEEINEERWPWAQKYDRPGWGWFFYKDDVRFFVRGIKNGISVTQVK
jgi:hypothetical protein